MIRCIEEHHQPEIGKPDWHDPLSADMSPHSLEVADVPLDRDVGGVSDAIGAPASAHVVEDDAPSPGKDAEVAVQDEAEWNDYRLRSVAFDAVMQADSIVGSDEPLAGDGSLREQHCRYRRQNELRAEAMADHSLATSLTAAFSASPNLSQITYWRASSIFILDQDGAKKKGSSSSAHPPGSATPFVR
jgi:hypothetical protein